VRNEQSVLERWSQIGRVEESAARRERQGTSGYEQAPKSQLPVRLTVAFGRQVEMEAGVDEKSDRMVTKQKTAKMRERQASKRRRDGLYHAAAPPKFCMSLRASRRPWMQNLGDARPASIRQLVPLLDRPAV
jgi:hypothetical protein